MRRTILRPKVSRAVGLLVCLICLIGTWLVFGVYRWLDCLDGPGGPSPSWLNRVVDNFRSSRTRANDYAIEGDVFLDQKRYDEAIKKFQVALYIDPDNAATHLSYGNALVREGRKMEARSEWKKALGQHANLWYASKDAQHLVVEEAQKMLSQYPETK